MPDRPANHDRLIELIVAQLHGEIDAADHEELQSILRDSPDARELYGQWLTDALLLRRWANRGLESSADDAPDAADALAQLHSGQTVPHPPAKKAAGRLTLPNWGPWAIAATLVVAIPLVAAFAYWYRIQWNASSSAGQLPAPVAVFFESSHDAEFTYDGPGERDYIEFGRSVYPGVVDLTRGTLTFKFNCDAEVTVTGPAKFGLNDDRRAFLHVGKLAAYCPEQAKGFTIGAPGCAVIDLGTRFTMLVDSLGFTDVAVLGGRVDLRRDNGELVSLIRGASARAPRDLTERLTSQGPLFTAPILTVTGLTGDLYVNDTLARLGGEHPAGTIELTTGDAELRLTNGVKLDLRGKTHLTLDNLTRATLATGSASFDCPPDVEPYTVHLPDGSHVASRGAAFRVDVSDTGRATLRVVGGEVTWNSVHADVTPVRLAAGQSVRIGNGALVTFDGVAAITITGAPPVVHGDDIANLAPGVGQAKLWTDTSSHGQTFTTGDHAAGYVLNAVTWQIGRSVAPHDFAVRVGEVSGANFSVVAQQSGRQTTDNQSGDFIIFKFDKPVSLKSNTHYGVEIEMTASGSRWETGIPYLSTTDDLYSNGQRYSRTSSDVTTISFAPGDLIFHLDITAVGKPSAPIPIDRATTDTDPRRRAGADTQ